MVEIQISGPERLHDADPDVQTMHSNSDEAGKPGGKSGKPDKAPGRKHADSGFTGGGTTRSGGGKKS